MRHDIPNVGTMSEQYPHLIFHNFSSDRGQRVHATIILAMFLQTWKLINSFSGESRLQKQCGLLKGKGK